MTTTKEREERKASSLVGRLAHLRRAFGGACLVSLRVTSRGRVILLAAEQARPIHSGEVEEEEGPRKFLEERGIDYFG